MAQIHYDLWYDAFRFITRKQMANHVSLVCLFFKEMCWPRLHGNRVTPHMVDALRFEMGSDENDQPRAMLRIDREREHMREEIPIAAAAPPPDYIQGFISIRIFYLDSELLKFIRNIRPLLANVNLYIGVFAAISDIENFVTALNGCSIYCLDIFDASFSISGFRRHFPGLVENIPVFSVDATDDEDWLELNALILARMESGKPFFYEVYGIEIPPVLIDNIKKAFQTAVQPLSFMITLYVPGPPLDEFRLGNEGTGEVLALERTEVDEGYSQYKVYRCPRGEEQQWTEEADGKFTSAEGTDISLE